MASRRQEPCRAQAANGPLNQLYMRQLTISQYGGFNRLPTRFERDGCKCATANSELKTYVILTG